MTISYLVSFFFATFLVLSIAQNSFGDDLDSDLDARGLRNNWRLRRTTKPIRSVSYSSGRTESTGDQCDWYGKTYPICTQVNSGWGWENNQSCLGRSTCLNIIPGNGGNSGGGNGSCNGSCPRNLMCPYGLSCGCYIVPGLGANKLAFLNVGADRNFLASAMMETEKMDSHYTYGDAKIGDSFNAGAAKQNWGMMRNCHPQWNRLGAYDYETSAQINDNRQLDVQVYNECRSYYGGIWFAGHRNGASGLKNPNTPDIIKFKAGFDWTYQQLAGHECDDVRFWVSLPAI